MKKSTCFLILLLAFAQVYAQAPQSFKYQSVARNASGNLLVNSSLGVRISIRDLTASGTIVFRETHSVTTNEFGLFAVSVGAGTVISGNFPGIDWGGSAKFLEVEVDFSGGTSYQSMGASQLLSVPYALYAANGPQGPAGAQGPPGPAGIQGPAGAAGLNVLSGAVNPTAGIGVNGEFYINTMTNTLFGPKAAGVWPAGVSLIGPSGATGPTGSQGPAGPTGANGAAGMNGLNILSGASNPVGSTGVNGEFYINTTTNTLFGPKAAGVWPAGVSLIGPAGSTGATGPQGPVGPTGLLSPGSTAGNTPYWNGTSWVTNNSNVFNNGGNVGIGTTAPGAKLDIAGAIKISDGTQGAGKVLTSNASGLASWQPIPGGGNMMSSNNLSDVASVPAARANLGLGSLAILSSVGSAEITDGTVSSVDILDGTIANTDIASVDAGKITSGTLPVVRGGSGLASVVPGAVAYGGATNFAFTAVGTAGQLLQSNGVGAPSWVNAPVVGWGLTGNSGTVDITNFIGTTDNAPLNIRVNNQKSGRVDPAGPVFLGYQSGNVNTGINNTGIGFMALATNTTGNFNTAIGNTALSSNTTGDRNTALGHASLNSNTIGYDNTSIGRASLFANTIGNQNTAIATYALNSNISGSDNTAIGWESMRLNLTGVRNTAVGVGSLKGNADGINNTALGRYALYTNTTGSGNTAVGVNAGSFGSNGSFNTAIGMAAGATVENLTNTTAIGFAAEVTASNSIVLGGTGANAVKVGIGLTAPAATLDILGNIKISDGTQGAGKVLTSNASGLASWQPIPGGGNMMSSNNLSDVASVPAARANLGLGSLATLSTVTTSEILNGTIVDADIQSIDAAKVTTGVVPVIRGGTGITAVVPGAIAYGGATNFGFTSAGLPGQLLQSNGASQPTWVNPPATFTSENVLAKGSAGGLVGSQLWAVSNNPQNDIFIQGTTPDGLNSINVFGITGRLGAAFQKFFILSTNTGIGTMVPTEALDVSGNLKFSGALMPNNLPGTSGQVLTSAGAGLPPIWSNASSGWGLSGTSGTIDGANFIGTTDNVPVNFRVNNQKAGRIDPNGPTFLGFASGSSNTAVQSSGFGSGALFSNTTGDFNTGMGYQSMYFNTTGFANTAFGTQALYSNTTGRFNSAIGSLALFSNTTGIHNVGYGTQSLYNTTTGNGNVAMGDNSLYTNTTGAFNIAIGMSADVTSGGLQRATAIGYNAKVSASNSMVLGGTGTDAIKVGIGVTSPAATLDILGNIKIADGSQGAGKVLTSDGLGVASWQTLVGGGNMISTNNLSDVANIAVARTNLGLGTLATLSTVGTAQIADGTIASVDILDGTINNADIATVDASKVTTGTLPVARGGSGITVVVPGAIAYGGATSFAFTATGTPGQILQSNGAAAPTWVNASPAAWGLTGSGGTVDGVNFIGTTDNIALNFRVNNLKAGRIDPAGGVFLGYLAGNVNTVQSNTGIGYRSLQANTTGSQNTASGYQAMYSTTTGRSNAAYGSSALYSNTTGDFNTAIGMNALYSNTSGVTNTAVGHESLLSNTTGARNTAIGVSSLSSNVTGSFNTAVGSGALLNNNSNNNSAFGFGALSTNLSGTDNSSFGFSALFLNTTGNQNAAFGSSALYSNTGGNSNSAFGNRALYSNTSGLQNTAIGESSLYTNGTGSENTSVGFQALYFNSNGNFNTALGSKTLRSNTTGTNNTAIGNLALYNNTTAVNNTAVGGYAMNDNTTGINNTAIGYASLSENISGNYNTASGYAALATNSTGNNNVATGNNALFQNLTGSNNTATGYQSLYANTGGQNNTSVGSQSLFSNSTGAGNAAFGFSALYSNQTGHSNVASGRESMYLNLSGRNNVASGYQALYSNTIGNWNTAVGSLALFSNTDGTVNTANGNESLFLNTTGTRNTAIGGNALYSNESGSFNTAVGVGALQNNQFGTYNTAIGYNASVSSSSFTNATAIGNGALVDASNKVRIGNNAVTVIEFPVSPTVASDQRLKENIKDSDLGLSFIQRLRPVQYTMKNGNGRTDFGFIAQELNEALHGLTSNLVSKDGEYFHVRYTDLIAPLVKAVQEQQHLIDVMAAEIITLKDELRNKKEVETLDTLEIRLRQIEAHLGLRFEK